MDPGYQSFPGQSKTHREPLEWMVLNILENMAMCTRAHKGEEK